MSLAPGTIFAHYRIVRLIGSGGMGAVYDAVQLGIERHVALKVLHAKLLTRPEAVRRFLSEARAVNLVDHPSVVPISEAGELEDGTVYLVMDFLRGESMMSRIRRHGGKLPFYEVVRFARQVAAALAAAHAKGIVHRDLKPDNLMLVPDPEILGKLRVRILDFGIAKLMEQDSEASGKSLTIDNTIIGTPRYMSPEQCRGNADINEKADVYSLGVILYEALAGRPPFQGQATTEVMAMHMYEPPPPLADAGVTAPDVLIELLMKMLSKERTARPSMAMIAATLTEPEVDPLQSMSALGQHRPSQPEFVFPADPSDSDGGPHDEHEDGTMNLPDSVVPRTSPTSRSEAREVVASPPPPKTEPKSATPGETRREKTGPSTDRATQGVSMLVPLLLMVVLLLAGCLVWALSRTQVADAKPIPATVPAAAPGDLSPPAGTDASSAPAVKMDAVKTLQNPSPAPDERSPSSTTGKKSKPLRRS